MSEHLSFCRICEPMCGMTATVDGDRIVRLRPDRDHPITAGFGCPKGVEMLHVQNDPERVLHPLRRTGEGDFERVTWKTALREIGGRLRAVRDRHGGESIGWYAGNPAAFSHSHGLWATGFMHGVGSRHMYSPNTQDTASRLVASALLYGNPLVTPLPDLHRTSFLLMVGANPVVSRGSLIHAGNLRSRLDAIVARGGRVVVVDPRRTETAKAYEHLPVRPDGDAWLLLAMLGVLFSEGLADTEAITRQVRGAGTLRDAALRCPPELAAAHCGVPADAIRRLARDVAAAPSACVYGRTGACLGRHATLVNVLLDALNAVTGNLDVPGGAVFGRGAVDIAGLAARSGTATYDRYRSRVGQLPEIAGQLPAPLMADEILRAGPGQMRALIVSAGNPLLTVPGADRLEQALDTLDLQIGIDLYLNETHRHADYVLPAATFYEREDLVFAFLDFQLTPFLQWTDAVVPPRGEAREDWRIIEDLAGELGFAAVTGPATAVLGHGRLGRLALSAVAPVAHRVTPAMVVDVLLRSGRDGDLFGLRRGGLNLAKVRAAPRGLVVAPEVETGVLRRKVTHRDGMVHLDDPVIAAELERLLAVEPADGDHPLRLIGRRQVRSQNSWMHNTPAHRRPRFGQVALVNPLDAQQAGVADGDMIRISTATGSIELPARVSDEIAAGAVAVPHGWGHGGGGWSTANAAAGANVNAILPGSAEHLEQVSGMSHLNGVPVRITVVSGAG